jgi:hypothetical protein
MLTMHFFHALIFHVFIFFYTSHTCTNTPPCVRTYHSNDFDLRKIPVTQDIPERSDLSQGASEKRTT